MTWKKIILGELSWKRLLSSFVIIYLLINLMAYYYSEKLIFPYNKSSYDDSLYGLEFITAEDNTQIASKIATRFWQAENETHLILYFHGNYLDLGDLDDVGRQLNAYGYSVLAMDYRGYGLSQGMVTEKNSYQDAHSLYNFALDKGYTSRTIIILGRSVGSGIAVELARKNKAKALVLISPFASAFRVMTKIPVLPFDRFNNYAKLSQIEEPLFIIHGSDDQIIKPWHSQELYNKYTGQKQRHLVKGAGHNDIWHHNLRPIFNKLANFLK